MERLFCKHEYVYYTKEPAADTFFFSRGIDGSAIYKFVCKKCGKVISIDQYGLENELESAHSEEKRREALGEPINSGIERIEIAPYRGIPTQYEGKYVSLLMGKYKKCGIDLHQLSRMGC